MEPKKIVGPALALLLLAGVLYPQSLAELAKKEKERRAALKAKRAAVVTNADLAGVKKKPAVVNIQEALPAPPAPAEEAGEEIQPPEPAAEVSPEEMETPPPQAADEGVRRALEERLRSAQEILDLYQTKLNALWQEFYSLDDMTSRDSIQQQISDVYMKLLKAQEEEAAARKDLEDYLSSVGEQSGPPLWVR
jgi:hypothetical protein